MNDQVAELLRRVAFTGFNGLIGTLPINPEALGKRDRLAILTKDIRQLLD
ncbi:hypothetical protein [Pseudomonas brassicacearum]|nr:hypothetical protein [Pseudomonas brassicacearum]